MRLFAQVTWISTIGLMITGGLLGAAYAHHLAAKRIPVALKSVDHIRTACAQHIEGLPCLTPSQKPSIQFEYVQDGNFKDVALLVEFEYEDPEGFAMAKRFVNDPHGIGLFMQQSGRLPERSAIPLILSGAAVGLSLAGLLGLLSYSFLRARARKA
jgi:hypothetical protein